MALLNGRLPLGSLAPIPWAPSHRLRPDAAAALTRLNAAFRAAFGHDLIVNEGYRDYATQESYRARTRLPRTDPRWLPSASRPGTSEHGWGLAVDLGQLGGFGSVNHRWLTQHAPRHGFYQPAQYQAGGAYPEPWHWEYDPARDTHPPEDIMASLDEVSALLDQKIKALRLQLRADMIEQTKKVVTPEAVARVLLDAQVPEHPELTGTEARRVGVVLRDTRIQTARIDKRTRE